MQLVPSTPNSKPVPESIRGVLAAISQNDLREVVEGISVPRPTGTPENEAVDVPLELTARSGPPEAGNTFT